VPKIFGAALILQSPEKRKFYRSAAQVLACVAAETIYSMLLAPILMLFYTRFVLATLCGFKVGWGSQARSGENGPGLGAWLKVHWVNTIVVLAAAGLVAGLEPALLPWMIPVLAGPLLAVPFSEITASRSLGLRARAKGWFVTPEEINAPAELKEMEDPFMQPAPAFFRAKEYAADYGLLQAVLDPYINAIHVSLLRQRTDVPVRTREYMALLADKLLLDGPFVLTLTEKRALLWDAEEMLAMHEKLWSSPPTHLHEWWQAAFRHYVESSALSVRRTIYV